VVGGAGGVVFASLFLHPYGAVKDAKSPTPLLAGADVNPTVFAIVERSCRNCHSEKTEWPWYSYIAPISWLVESDVAIARSQMNLSRWSEYTTEKRQELLGRIAAAVRSRQMPPARYTFIHPSTRLSPVERDQLYQWARAERSRLRSPMAAPESQKPGAKMHLTVARFRRGIHPALFCCLTQVSAHLCPNDCKAVVPSMFTNRLRTVVDGNASRYLRLVIPP
jgi:hypothetical protein